MITQRKTCTRGHLKKRIPELQARFLLLKGKVDELNDNEKKEFNDIIEEVYALTGVKIF